MQKLYLIKHSMPELNLAVPAPEWHLGELGRGRCKLLAQKLAAYPLDVIVSSVEPKAIETARIVATRLGKPHEIGVGLHEHDRRNVPFMPTAELEARVAEFFAKPNELVLGNETANAAHARFADAIERVIEKHPQKNIAVVAHGTVISLFVARTNPMPFEFWKRLGLPSIVVMSPVPNPLLDKGREMIETLPSLAKGRAGVGSWTVEEVIENVE
ncbi:MAG: histidine phosphatase family protein [Chloroflexi bacterium]|nr:histidine phosphatase family protein [Chloroflexota bacterium]